MFYLDDGTLGGPEGSVLEDILSIVLTGDNFVISCLCWVHGDILECQKAITSGFALGISLPDTQVYPPRTQQRQGITNTYIWNYRERAV